MFNEIVKLITDPLKKIVKNPSQQLVIYLMALIIILFLVGPFIYNRFFYNNYLKERAEILQLLNEGYSSASEGNIERYDRLIELYDNSEQEYISYVLNLPEPKQTKSNGERLILFLGGSFVFAWGIIVAPFVDKNKWSTLIIFSVLSIITGFIGLLFPYYSWKINLFLPPITFWVFVILLVVIYNNKKKK